MSKTICSKCGSDMQIECITGDSWLYWVCSRCLWAETLNPFYNPDPKSIKYVKHLQSSYLNERKETTNTSKS